MGESVDYVKTELMPDFDFDAFNHDENPDDYNNNQEAPSAQENQPNGDVVAEDLKVEPALTLTQPEVVAKATEPAEEVENIKNDTQEEVDKW